MPESNKAVDGTSSLTQIKQSVQIRGVFQVVHFEEFQVEQEALKREESVQYDTARYYGGRGNGQRCSSSQGEHVPSCQFGGREERQSTRKLKRHNKD